MLAPTNSDDPISVYRKEKLEKKINKFKKIFFACLLPSSFFFLLFYVFILFLFYFILKWDPHVPFLSLLGPFYLRNKSFRSSFNFIYPKWTFFNYLTFFKIFLKSRFHVSLYTRCLEIRKIFRMSRNLTKFDRVTRFREMNLTAQSVSSSEI